MPSFNFSFILHRFMVLFLFSNVFNCLRVIKVKKKITLIYFLNIPFIGFIL